MICARGGSTGVPWKNKQSPFENQNIYQRIKEKIKQTSKANYKIVVNTNDPEIESIANDAGLKVFRRREELGSNTARLVDVNYQYKLESNDNFDYLINISPVAPFLQTKSIKQAVELIHKNNYNCGGTATKHTNNSHPVLAMQRDIKTNNINYLIKADLRYPRQQRFETFYANGCLFFRKACLIKANKSNNDLDESFFPIYTDEIESINIDSNLDWEIAKLISSSTNFTNYH